MNGGSGWCGSFMIVGIFFFGVGRLGRRFVNFLGRWGRCGWLIWELFYIVERENRDNGNNVGRSFLGRRFFSSVIGRCYYGWWVVF